MTERLSWEEYQRIKNIKILDLQICSYCAKLNILNLGWKAFGKWYCEKEEKEHVLCWEFCYKVCLNVLGCELKQIRKKRTEREQTVAVNQKYYKSSCYLCQKELKGAGKHGIIKNRNDPKFWGIGSSYKIMCLVCIGKRFYNRLSAGKRKTFKKYLKRGYE